MRTSGALNGRGIRSNAKSVVGGIVLFLVGASAVFAQASADPSALQATRDDADQKRQLTDQINQLRREIANLQSDIDPTGPNKKVGAKQGMMMNPAPNKSMGMADDKSKMSMPPGNGPAPSGSAAMGMKDDQAEMGGMSPGSAAPTPPTSPAAAESGGMGAGMANMPKQVGVAPGKEAYPSLMALPDEVTPEQRARIEHLAHERMQEGAALMSSGLEKMSKSTSGEDYVAMQQAAAQLREGLGRFEGGIAARRMLLDGKAPRNLALDWFKRELNLAAPRLEEPRGLFGVTTFHLVTMALLITFAVAMLAMYFFKMRRAAALFGRVDSEAKTASPGASPEAPGKSASEALPPGSASAPNPPAKPAAGTPASGSVPLANGASSAPAPTADSSKTAGRADELWKARGRPFGSPKIDWLRAEEELAKEAGSKPPAAPPAGVAPAAPATPPTVTAVSS